MADFAFLEQFENFQAGECGFEPHVLQVAGIAHGLP
jgi:hypothetical protein